jgi:uncharacterized protein YjbI with pentapeptide repeats
MAFKRVWRCKSWQQRAQIREQQNKEAPTQDQIRARAYNLSKIAPWRSASENWEIAQHELASPTYAQWARNAVLWLGSSGKTGWDWIDFIARLSIPIVLALGGWYVSTQSTMQQQKINDENQRDMIVSEYIQNMQQLVLREGLNKSGPNDPVAVIARSMTLTTLSRLRANENAMLSEHKGQVLLFLSETGLINSGEARLSLRNADFSRAQLRGLSLGGINLSMVNLRGSNVSSVYLSGANLTMADLTGANLKKSYLGGANLGWANLRGADLTNTMLGHTFLGNTDLRGANLGSAYLREVEWSPETKWPEPDKFKGAVAVPIALMKMLGL